MIFINLEELVIKIINTFPLFSQSTLNKPELRIFNTRLSNLIRHKVTRLIVSIYILISFNKLLFVSILIISYT
jgi:hypothetical protein